jgi:MerR family transcriptional regulator, copper efflux regulator
VGPIEGPGDQKMKLETAGLDERVDGQSAGLHQIGEIARQTHLSLRTLRYWEEVGLIRPTGRTAGGFRLYSDDELVRVQLVRAMKPADLTIDELRELADLVEEIRGTRMTRPGPDRKAVARLEAFIARIRTRCELLRGRIDDAEAATLDLERLIEDATSPHPLSAAGARSSKPAC